MLVQKDQFVTPEQAAAIIGCSPDWVRKLLNRGEITGIKLHSKAWLVDVNSATEYAHSERKPGPK
jgi:hypothetical protein